MTVIRTIEYPIKDMTMRVSRATDSLSISKRGKEADNLRNVRIRRFIIVDIKITNYLINIILRPPRVLVNSRRSVNWVTNNELDSRFN